MYVFIWCVTKLPKLLPTTQHQPLPCASSNFVRILRAIEQYWESPRYSLLCDTSKASLVILRASACLSSVISSANVYGALAIMFGTWVAALIVEKASSKGNNTESSRNQAKGRYRTETKRAFNEHHYSRLRETKRELFVKSPMEGLWMMMGSIKIRYVAFFHNNDINSSTNELKNISVAYEVIITRK